MRFNLRTRPIHCQIWTLTIDMLAPQIFRAYSEFAWHTNLYCPLELQIWPDIFQVCTCKFLLCANLMTNLEFAIEFAAIAMNSYIWTLQLHCERIWRRLPWRKVGYHVAVTYASRLEMSLVLATTTNYNALLDPTRMQPRGLYQSCFLVLYSHFPTGL